jgi:hypothetical protein
MVTYYLMMTHKYYNMLLASNPQLQKVSKQRAERILKARFPEYFEG